MPAAELSESAVRDHFDENRELYTDQYRDTYTTVCLDRLRMLTPLFRPDQPISLLDIGCGGGIFTDLFLSAYPRATAWGLDLSEKMLRSNLDHPRKHLMLASARSIPLRPAMFDVINIDTIMHHLIDFGGYAKTVEGIGQFLDGVKSFLAPGGVIAIREIYHESFLRDNLGARCLFVATTTPLPAVCVSVLKKAGVNTANAGVCFLTRSQWRSVIDRAGYSVRSLEAGAWPRSVKLMACGFRGSGALNYIISP
jgi:SAM-dependent methyltransferase